MFVLDILTYQVQTNSVQLMIVNKLLKKNFMYKNKKIIYDIMSVLLALISIFSLIIFGKLANLYFLIKLHTVFLLITYVLTKLFSRFCPNNRIQQDKDNLKTLGYEYLVGLFPVIIWNAPMTAFLTSDYPKQWLNFNYDPTNGTLLFVLQVVAHQFVHDIYVFSIHKYMLHSRYFWFMHKPHHIKTPSLITAFTLSVWENAIQSIDMIIIANIFRMHYDAFMTSFLLACVVGLYSHLGFDLFPSWWNKSIFTCWHISTSYHDLHHSQGKCNYGYILTWWDHLTGSYKSNKI